MSAFHPDLPSNNDPLLPLALSIRMVGMHFARPVPQALAACLILLVFTSGCSNEVRQIPANEVRPDGTYVVAALRNERPAPLQRSGPEFPSNVVVSEAVTPPGVSRERMLRRFEFIRADDNSCIGADTIAFEFPEYGAGTRYVAFALPAATYTARGVLRDQDMRAPSFDVPANRASYLGDLTIEANGDISVRPNLAEAQRHVPARLQALPVGYRPPMRFKVCAP